MLPLLAVVAQAQALTAGSFTARWVQGDIFANPSVTPHSIADAEFLLGLQPGDNGYLAEATTVVDHLDFYDGASGAEGLFVAGSIMDPFTSFEPVSGTFDDPQFAVSVTGTLLIPTNGGFSFQVHSDDGFDFRIGGVSVFSLDGDRSPETSRIDLVDLTAGQHDFELIGWEQGGQFVLELSWAPDGSENFAVLSTTPVPIPGTLPLLGSALAGLALRRRW